MAKDSLSLSDPNAIRLDIVSFASEAPLYTRAKRCGEHAPMTGALEKAETPEERELRDKKARLAALEAIERALQDLQASHL